MSARSKSRISLPTDLDRDAEKDDEEVSSGQWHEEGIGDST